MTYALDTNIISYILNGNDRLADTLDSVARAGDTVVLPLIVYYETRRGLLFNEATAKMRAFDRLCSKLDIHKLTKTDMNKAADIYADRKRRGLSIYDADLLIAAQCAAKGHTLVTANTRHFEQIEGLQIVNWVE